ncbi:MAG: lipopolysaccharide heptosyltransferase II [Pseudomonadales bacterium]
MAAAATDRPRKLLIVAPAWVGDMVMAHTLVQLLLQQASAQGVAAPEIHMLAPPATAALGERMPGVAQTHVFDLAHGELGLGKRWAFAKTLRAQGFAQALVLPNSLKSALVPWWAQIERRTGWTGESRVLLLNDRRTLDKDRYPLMIERFMALALATDTPLPKPYPMPVLQADADQCEALLLKHQLTTPRPILALCPGAEFGPAKRWPEQHFAAVAADAVRAGYDVWLFGSPKDQPVGAALLDALAHDVALPAQLPAQLPRSDQAAADDRLRLPMSDGQLAQVVNLAGQTKLLEAVDLLAVADAVVCNDSGLMHVAAALGIRVVAVYGSTSPDFTPPLSAVAQVLQQPQPCSPCFERECPLQHMNCLNELLPARVSRALGL